MNKSLKHIFIVVVAIFGLTACATQPDNFGKGDPVKPMSRQEAMMMSVRNANLEKQVGKIKANELIALEKVYRTNPTNSKAALEYAQMLRKTDLVEQSLMILKPFADKAESRNEEILVEYTKGLLKSGDFETAQIYAQNAFAINQSPESQMVLGVAVDAQTYHEAAENHFRQALLKVKDDEDLRKAIQNNLALCLMSQGKISEAQGILDHLNMLDTNKNSDVIEANKDLSKKL